MRSLYNFFSWTDSDNTLPRALTFSSAGKVMYTNFGTLVKRPNRIMKSSYRMQKIYADARFALDLILVLLPGYSECRTASRI